MNRNTSILLGTIVSFALVRVSFAGEAPKAKETCAPMRWTQRIDISDQCAVVEKTVSLDKKAKIDPDRMVRNSIEVHYFSEGKPPKVQVIKSYEAKLRNASLGLYAASRKFNMVALFFQERLYGHVLLYNEKTGKVVEHKRLFDIGGADSRSKEIHHCQIVWSMTSPYLYLTTVESTVELWNIRTGKKLLTHEEPHTLSYEVMDCYSRPHESEKQE